MTISASIELAHRQQDGLEVTLFWDGRLGVSVEVVDVRNENAFAFPVDAESALDAFYHPYAYAPVLDDDVLALATFVNEEAPA
jgi:hypothetical protein